MPSESIPASFAGFKLVTTMTFFPTIWSGLYQALMPLTICLVSEPIFTWEQSSFLDLGTSSHFTIWPIWNWSFAKSS